MATSKKQTQEIQEVQTIYSIENRDRILKVLRTSSPDEEGMNEIHRLYQLFVDPNQTYYTPPGKCGGCGNGISRLFQKLADWFNSSIHLFPSEYN